MTIGSRLKGMVADSWKASSYRYRQDWFAREPHGEKCCLQGFTLLFQMQQIGILKIANIHLRHRKFTHKALQNCVISIQLSKEGAERRSPICNKVIKQHLLAMPVLDSLIRKGYGVHTTNILLQTYTRESLERNSVISSRM